MTVRDIGDRLCIFAISKTLLAFEPSRHSLITERITFLITNMTFNKKQSGRLGAELLYPQQSVPIIVTHYFISLVGCLDKPNRSS